MQCWVKTATLEQLQKAATELASYVADERNPMKRSSLNEQIRIVKGEQFKRGPADRGLLTQPGLGCHD